MSVRRYLTKHKQALAGLMAVALMLVAFQTAALGADGFGDVPDSNVHHGSVNAVRDAGVTQGCTSSAYCPDQAVRRDQMASFLDRLGALSGQTPVVNAATALEAEDSNALGGVDAEAVLNAIRILGERTGDGDGSGDGAIDAELLQHIETLETELAAATDRIGILEGDLADTNGLVGTLQGDVADTNGIVGTLQGDLADANGVISTLEGNLADANGQISSLESQLGDATTRISDLEALVADLIATLDSLGLDLGGLDLGLLSAESTR